MKVNTKVFDTYFERFFMFDETAGAIEGETYFGFKPKFESTENETFEVFMSLRKNKSRTAISKTEDDKEFIRKVYDFLNENFNQTEYQKLPVYFTAQESSRVAHQPPKIWDIRRYGSYFICSRVENGYENGTFGITSSEVVARQWITDKIKSFVKLQEKNEKIIQRANDEINNSTTSNVLLAKIVESFTASQKKLK